MGLFFSLRGTAAAPANDPDAAETDAARAAIALPLIAAAPDGRIDAAMLERIVSICHLSPLFRAIGVKATRDCAQATLDDLRSGGAEALFRRVLPAFSPELAETGMCLAIRAALSTDRGTPEDMRRLIAMGERLGLPEATFHQIVEVMTMVERRVA